MHDHGSPSARDQRSNRTARKFTASASDVASAPRWNRGDGLRVIQREMHASKRCAHPYYWADQRIFGREREVLENRALLIAVRHRGRPPSDQRAHVR